MKYQKGLVSVVLPTYRRSNMLPRAIDSVLSQSYHEIELFVVNDNDPCDNFTKKVKDIALNYSNDSRFHLIIQNSHINGAVARNVAIREAKGEYIAFLDDDDWWEPNKIKEQVKELSSLDNTWGGVSCKFTLYDKKGKIVGRTKKYKDGYIYKDILCLCSDVATGTILLRHEALDQTGYFDEKLLRNQDIQLLAQFTYMYKLKQVDMYLHCVDISDNQNRVVTEEKLLAVRKALYLSLKDLIGNLSRSEFRCIDAMRDLEMGYVLFSHGQYVKGVKYIISVLRSLSAIVLAFKKLKSRIDLKR